MKLYKKTTATLLIAVFMISAFAVAIPVSAAVPVIDGVLDPDEWGDPLCMAVGSFTGTVTVTVYAHATTDALYLAFDTNDVTDNRDGLGLDVLDWNIGLVGSDFAPPSYPWRYVLVTKVSHDASWGDSWDVIDGYHGSWGDTWNIPAYYSHIPVGLEMVTSFATGHRVTEFMVPMSIMFDGEHGWEGPNGGETLLLGGTFSGEDVEGTHDMAWWPQDINHHDEATYETIEIPLPPDIEPPTITEVNVEPTTVNRGDLLTITASVTDNVGVVAVSADFSYNPEYTDRPSPTSVPMYSINGDTYRVIHEVPSDWLLGDMIIKVAARDAENWIRSDEFVVVTVIPTIQEAVEFIEDKVEHHGLANSLISKLENVQDRNFEKILNAFMNEVDAQSDKKIDPIVAEAIIEWAIAWSANPDLAE